jgi:type VI secretion system protein ImpC
MEETFSLTDVEGELLATVERSHASLSDETPFQVLLLGDWSGRGNRGLNVSSAELSDWRPRIVDRDNLNQVMARLGVKLRIPLASNGSPSLTITFDQLDDFHPDRLFRRLDIFESLGRTRSKLNHTKTFQEAAAEVRGWSEVAASERSRVEPARVSEDPPPPPYSGGSLLDQILDRGPDASSGDSSSASGHRVPEVSPEIFELAKAAVKDHLVPDVEGEKVQLIAAVDSRIAETMRAILHDPHFQALESSWRALDLLVSRLDTGNELRLHLLDISFEEFRADLQSDKDFHNTAIYKLLVEQTIGTPGGIPWAVVAGNYIFDLAGGDSGWIEPVSMIAREAGAPFIFGTTARFLGCQSLFQTPDPDDWQVLDPQIEEWWEGIRNLPSAAYVGFALPRFLLRLPYGRNTEPTEEFVFEEIADADAKMTAAAQHESYLWANPAFGVAFLLAKGFGESGWAFRPSDSLEIEGLPLHIYKSRDGDTEIKPCAEVLLTVRAAEKIIDRGLMPLLSMKESDIVRLGMVQSIAGTQLAGPWNEH